MVFRKWGAMIVASCSRIQFITRLALSLWRALLSTDKNEMLIPSRLMVPSKTMENSASLKEQGWTPRPMKTLISTAGPTILNVCVLSGNWQLFRRYFCSTNLVQPDGPEVTCSGDKISILGQSCLEGETIIIRGETSKSSGSIAELGAGTGGGVGWNS